MRQLIPVVKDKLDDEDVILISALDAIELCHLRHEKYLSMQVNLLNF